MPTALKRIYGRGHLHFLTFSCYKRLPFFKRARARDVFLQELARLHRLKLRLAKRLRKRRRRVPTGQIPLQFEECKEAPRPFWQPRFHDFNVYSPGKRVGKLNYMHANPVKRGLVNHPGEWPWSSWAVYHGQNALLAMASAD
jgi:putative transposase